MDARNRQFDRLIDRYRNGESVDISGLPESTRVTLEAERSALEASRKRYEDGQAAKGRERAEALRAAYLAADGTTEGWAKEGPDIVRADRAERTRTAAAAPTSLIAPHEFFA